MRKQIILASFAIILAARVANCATIKVRTESEVERLVEMGKSVDAEPHFMLKIYIENQSEGDITIPTEGYEAIFSLKQDVCFIRLYIPESEVRNGKTIARSTCIFRPVILHKGEIAIVKHIFLSPTTNNEKVNLKSTLKVSKTVGDRYGFWFGEITTTAQYLYSHQSTDK